MFLGLTVGAQGLPTLQMTNHSGTRSVVWSGATAPWLSLQTTTNLLRPVVWSPFSAISGAGSSNVTIVGSQKYFRIAQSLPLFQFEIFYNENLEISPGGSMVINGPVFCNQSIWEGSISCTFSTNVTAVVTNNVSAADPFANNYAGSSSSVFSMPGQPRSHAPPLALTGLGTNISPAALQAIVGLPPSTNGLGSAGAYTGTGLIYLANEVDLVISNAVFGTNWGTLPPQGTNLTVYYQDPARAPNYLTLVAPDLYLLKKPVQFTNSVSSNSSAGIDCITNVQFAGYSFLTNTAFWDFRESKTVQAVQIDLAKLGTWLTNMATNGGGFYNVLCLTDKGHALDSLFAYNSVMNSATTLPALRIVNGAVLPSPAGLTVVTPFPLYVRGNYNVQTNVTSVNSDAGLNDTHYTYPAALMADAVTLLSSNWSDAYNSSTGLGTRIPVTATINAAVLEGNVPSNPAIVGNYSGGFENFLRLEEYWSSSTPLVYNGSVAVWFNSQYATNVWKNPGNFYSVPARNWAFDTNFLTVSKLPPLTPMMVNLVSP